MSQGLSLSALARELGRAKSGLHRLVHTGQIPKNADGSFDLDAVTAALKSNLDPARSRPVRTPVQVNAGPVNDVNATSIFDCLDSFEDVADRKAVAVGLIVAHTIGAGMANMAIAAGAPIKVAFALREIATVLFMTDFEDAARCLGIATDAITYDADRMDDLDWSSRARDIGETVDPAAWQAWSDDRKRLLNSPSSGKSF